MIPALGLLSACQYNPATGQRNFNVLSEPQEIRLGSQSKDEFLRDYGGPIPSETIRQYVQELGTRLAAVSERPHLPWEFFVVDSALINAFSLPGGKIFVTRGLLAKLGSQAELAAVLGHEIAHVTAQHQGQQMSQALVLTAAMVGLGVAAERSDEDWLRVLGVSTQVGGTIYLLSFSRRQEYEADELALRYISRLGYHPAAMLRVLEKLQAESGSSNPLLVIFSTHPDPQARIQRLQRLIPQRYPEAQQPERYTWGIESYQQNVLNELTRLPAPKHTGSAVQKSRPVSTSLSSPSSPRRRSSHGR